MSMIVHGHNRGALLGMDVGSLRAILHERVHHGIEIFLYRILNGRLKKPDHFGQQARFVFDIWKERGLPVDTPDIQWCIQNLEIAERLEKGMEVRLATELPTPFTAEETRVVKKLLYERRSIRQFTAREVSDDLTREILSAGLWAPQGCNVDCRRFIVLRKREEWKLVKSDIPIENGVMIVICQDMKAYQSLTIDRRTPQNIYYDAACAADHMCLMAHALGLGACWLTHGEETQKKIRDYFELPEGVLSRCHIILGWPDEAPIKSQRMSLDDALITKRV